MKQFLVIVTLGVVSACGRNALPEACQPLRVARAELDWVTEKACPQLDKLELSRFDRLELERLCAYTKATEPRQALDLLCPHPQVRDAK